MNAVTIDARLLSCASFVRAGAVLADIGTDHGYLPVFLLKSGKICRAVLSDINAGPLASARENVEEAGLRDKCELVLTDGAAALGGRGITDYAICGMGGELIADIIDKAPEMKSEGIRLILQPMSRQAHLRGYLWQNGFSILDERYSSADGKSYVCILAEYTGECYSPSRTELELGLDLSHTEDLEEYLSFLEKKYNSLGRVIEGKTRGGENADRESLLRKAILERMKTIGDRYDSTGNI